MTLRPIRALGVLAFAGAAVAAPTATAAATHTVDCRGSGTRCTATFPLRGTHTRDTLVVLLTDTDLALRSIVPSSPKLPAVYGFGGFSTRLGGSEFRAVLLRSGVAPAGATITFTFAVPPAMRACGGAQRVMAHGVSCATARTAAAQCVAGTGPTAGRWPRIFQVDDTVSFQGGTRRVTFTPGSAGATCVPVG